MTIEAKHYIKYRINQSGRLILQSSTVEGVQAIEATFPGGEWHTDEDATPGYLVTNILPAASLRHAGVGAPWVMPSRIFMADADWDRKVKEEGLD